MQRSSAATAGLFLGALAGVVAGLLGKVPALREVEHSITDRLLTAFADKDLGRSSRVSIVLLQEQERSSVGEYLEALADRKVAALLLLDRQLAGSPPVVDPDAALLAAHLLAARRVVLAAHAESSGEAPFPPAALAEKDRVEVYGRSDLLPVPDRVRLPGRQLAEAADRIGITENHEEAVVRSLPVAYGVGDHFAPSLPVAVAMTAFGESSLNIVKGGRLLQRFAGIDLPLDGRGNLLLNFHGPGGTFRTIDGARLARALDHPKEPCEWLDALSKGDIVVLSVSAAGTSDTHSTPTDPGMSESEILATAIDNIVRGDPLARPAPSLMRFIAVLLGSLVGLSTAVVRRPGLTLLLPCALVTIYLATAVFLVHEGLLLDFLPPVAGTLLAIPSVRMFLRRSEHQRTDIAAAGENR